MVYLKKVFMYCYPNFGWIASTAYFVYANHVFKIKNTPQFQEALFVFNLILHMHIQFALVTFYSLDLHTSFLLKNVLR